MLTRRQLIKRSALLSLSPVVPAFLAHSARAAAAERNRRVLVVIQLDGGNDGLNTVVPMRDEQYARLRPKLAHKPASLIKLNDELGLHPDMKSAGRLFDDGRLAIIQGVGYPNPNRSHFRSMAIWHSARLDEAEHGQYGWLGRALDAEVAGAASPQAVFAGTGSLPVSLWSRHANVASLGSLDELALGVPTAMLRGGLGLTGAADEHMSYVARTCDEAFTMAERLSSLAAATEPTGEARYGQLNIAQQLRLIAALVKADSQARVFYTAQSGYDTHAIQANDHARLLRSLSDAIKVFLDDMATSGLAERVLVLAFSEFGRRAAENDSLGTDHGAAGPVLIAGPNLAAGLFGPTPNLADLVEGDVKTSIDFRQVYATVLDQWLDVRPADVLAGVFEPLRLFNDIQG